MNETRIETTVCHECYAVLDVVDNYCRHCGANVSGGIRAAGRPVAASVVERPKFSESPWVVLPLLFLVFGPLALPLLWRSRQFSRLWKIILTVVMAIVTVYLVWSIWYVVHQSLGPLRELEKLQRM